MFMEKNAYFGKAVTDTFEMCKIICKIFHSNQLYRNNLATPSKDSRFSYRGSQKFSFGVELGL